MMQERSCVGVVALSAELEQHCSCTEFISKAILQHTSALQWRGSGPNRNVLLTALTRELTELLHRSAEENNIVKIRSLCKL